MQDSDERTAMQKAAAAFAVVATIARLRGRRLDRLEIESSPFRRWIKIFRYRGE